MPTVELTVVMPCLNEADTLESCIRQAQASFLDHGIAGEVVVADNGSSDDSPDIAERCGARLIRVPQHENPQRNGYGNGLMTGIAAARGDFILMGDSDASYDFSDIPKFLDKLRQGYDLVMGCRFPAGGGRILKGAMPWLHRWIGTPLFSLLIRQWFGVPVTDVNCGMRAFRKQWFHSINQRCTGMEFAAEMIIKAGLLKARIAEVPITLAPDGRCSQRPHLNTFRDGWRILRHLFIYSPTWLYLVPGIGLILTGVIGGILALGRFQVGSIELNVHTLLFSCAFILCGYQAVLFAILAKTFAANEGLMPPSPWLNRFYRIFTLERGLAAGTLGFLCGLLFAVWALWSWMQVGFGHLDVTQVMRLAIPGAMLLVLGFQTVLASFFGSVLGMGKK